ncbi:hypothetical protein ASG17_03095 [Brevundimonas sp. Leaf363]|uniref:hypothetical protein n=1 Tax=Brevundimonas sp. Leaf363 TaxID=1736353 RepID=UPI0006F525EE|nr:hypothetical protein [Brevundimonas sp. Leaf363]KQS55100.1 hypothetical protein ASG17_03095 [Brevundimonas sp. Leaf363]
MGDPYRIRSDDTWARARADYLAGVTAEEVCGRYDLGLRALRARAQREQWRRVDASDPEPLDDDLAMGSKAPALADMADICMRRVARAIDRNRSAEAMRWLRVHVALSAQARARPGDTPAPAMDEMHDVHSKKPCKPSPSPSAPINRSQRRRAAARGRVTGAQPP